MTDKTQPREQIQERVSVKLEKLLKNAILQYQAGDRVDWDLGPIFSQQNPPLYYISLGIPGAVLGSTQMAGFLIADAHHQTQDYINSAVSTALNQLREARSEALNEAVGEAKELILPRG